MSATRTVKWGAAAVLLLAVSAIAYAGVGAAQGSWGPHSGPTGPTYNVTFNEAGLPAGTNWTVTVSGHGGHFGFHGHGQTSNTSSIVFSLPNGTYRYAVHPVRGFELSGAGCGIVNVSGASPAPINVTFATPTTYTVTFTETGLAAGTNWTVVVHGGHGGWFYHGFRHFAAETSSTSTITFSLPNGTYHYRVLNVRGYELSPSDAFGAFNVSGASPATVSVVFTQLVPYAVTFTETGLPSGTNWSVVAFGWAGGFPGSFSFVRGTSNTSTITLMLPNGTYLYHVGHVHGYTAGNTSFGVVNVTGGSPAPVTITFVAATYGGWGGPDSAAPAEAVVASHAG